MGCNQYSKTIIQGSIVSKLQKPQIIRAETNNTLSATNILSCAPSVKPQTLPEKRCYRCKLTPEFNYFVLEDLNNANPLSRKLYVIRKFWLVLTSSLNYFESATHSACIENYKIEDSIFILLTSVVAFKGYSVVVVDNSFPYLSFIGDFEKETQEIVKSWRKLAVTLNTIIEQKVEKQVERYVKKIEEYLVGCEAVEKFYMENAQIIANELLEKIRRVTDGISLYVKGMNKWKVLVEEHASSARAAGKYSAKDLVHLIR